MAGAPAETLSADMEQLNINTFTVPGKDYCENVFAFVKGKTFKARYKGYWPVSKTRTNRMVFELTDDGTMKEDLKLMKKLLENWKVWSGVSDPDMDKKKYKKTWRTAVWMTNKEEPSGLCQGSEYDITLTECELVSYKPDAEWKHGLEIRYTAEVIDE